MTGRPLLEKSPEVEWCEQKGGNQSGTGTNFVEHDCAFLVVAKAGGVRLKISDFRLED
jgi:hypothetical protein